MTRLREGGWGNKERVLSLDRGRKGVASRLRRAQ